MQLHRKLKALSEKSTSEFIRLIRMKRAAEMILNGQGTISEIAYEVGFNDPSYFTKCFRNEFGIPPSEYKDYMNGLQ
jgi:AraC-like DNA-binding protein